MAMSKKFLASFIFICLATTLYFGADVIPPVSLTYGTMHMIKRRILRYARLHNELPKDIKELPIIEGHGNGIRDAWGRKIIYTANKENTVTLISYGRDGLQGGSGDNEDMIGIFPLRDNDNRWEDELCDWSRDPFQRKRDSAARDRKRDTRRNPNE